MWINSSVVEFWLYILWSLVRYPVRKITVYATDETIVKSFRMSHTVIVVFSGHGNSIYNISSSKVGHRSQGRREGSLLNSYYTKV